MDLVLNLVWTPGTFPLFQLFTESLLEHTGSQLRFVGNNCPADELRAMERFAAPHGDRIVEVLDVSPHEMVPHGTALDRVLEVRDDGDIFGFIDPDIYLGGPFLSSFLPLLAEHDAVTSGKELWSDANVQPEDHVGIGVGGRHFFAADGFVFGSPHLALYRRSSLLDVVEHFDVGLGSNGQDIGPDALAAIEELGRTHMAFDTGKIVNILLQARGGSLVHTEHPALLHIGGLSHFVAPPKFVPGPDGTLEPDWVRNRGVEARAAIASYTVSVLESAVADTPPPPVPRDADPNLVGRMSLVRDVIGGARPGALAGGDDLPHWETSEEFKAAIEKMIAEEDFTNIDHLVQLTTGGGCATTALCEYLTEQGVDLQRGPGQWPFKHARVPPAADEVPPGFRVLYVIGDPRDAVLSLFRRGYQYGHAQAMAHDWRVTRERSRRGLPLEDPSTPPLSDATIARLRTLDTYLCAGVDEFDFGGHLDAWRAHPPGYPVLFVRYDHLGRCWDEVHRFLELPGDAPRFETRGRSSRWQTLPDHLRAMVQTMYGDLAERIESLPPTEIV